MSILDQFKLTGKRALVTGANRGLGRAIAIGLAEAGADIVSISRKPDATETEAGVRATGQSFEHVSFDLLDATAGDLRKLVTEVTTDRPPFDILVNNAGIIRRTPAATHSEASWDSVMGVNVKASYFLSQTVATQMHANGGGKIIFTSSILGEEGGLMVVSYTASKHAINGMVKALANEWAPYNINVNAIAPGYFATDMTDALQKDPERSRSLIERIPAGRFGKPDELKGLAVYLASDASSYVHGSIFNIDGGWLAR
ncbi:MAG: SDR family NAD(P)-dependent oxidoreductase [Chloroflexota bacterium]